MSEKSERELTIAKRWLNEQDAECALLKDRLGTAEAALSLEKAAREAAERRVGELEAALADLVNVWVCVLSGTIADPDINVLAQRRFSAASALLPEKGDRT